MEIWFQVRGGCRKKNKKSQIIEAGVRSGWLVAATWKFGFNSFNIALPEHVPKESISYLLGFGSNQQFNSVFSYLKCCMLQDYLSLRPRMAISQSRSK